MKFQPSTNFGDNIFRKRVHQDEEGQLRKGEKGETFVRDFFVDKPINDFVLDDNTRSSEGGS